MGLRIGIDGGCWSNWRGYGRYTRNLLSALGERDEGNEYLLSMDAESAAANDLPSGFQAVVVSLKFCMVTTLYPPDAFGGDGVFVWRLSNCLAAAGHTVEVIHCLDSYRAVGGQALPAGWDNHPNITLRSLHSGVGALSPLATYFTGRPTFKTQQLRALLADLLAKVSLASDIKHAREQ